MCMWVRFLMYPPSLSCPPHALCKLVLKDFPPQPVSKTKRVPNWRGESTGWGDKSTLPPTEPSHSSFSRQGGIGSIHLPRGLVRTTCLKHWAPPYSTGKEPMFFSESWTGFKVLCFHCIHSAVQIVEARGRNCFELLFCFCTPSSPCKPFAKKAVRFPGMLVRLFGCWISDY